MNRKNIVIYLSIFLVISGLIVAGVLVGQDREAVELDDNQVADKTDATSEVELYFFWSKTCPFCLTQKDFLESIEDDYPYLTIHSHEVSESEESYLLWLAVSKAYGIENPQGVPMTFISDRHFVGFAVDPIGHEIIQIIEECRGTVCLDPASLIEA